MASSGEATDLRVVPGIKVDNRVYFVYCVYFGVSCQALFCVVVLTRCWAADET